MTVTAIVTSHSIIPEAILRQLSEQTHKPDETVVLASGTDDLFKIGGKKLDHYELDVGLLGKFYREPNRNDWGHEKRAKGLKLATQDFVGFFNADDEYDPAYIEKLLAAAEREKADLVFCDFKSHLFGGNVVHAEPHIGSITSGDFLVRRKLAQKVGYNHRHYEADGQFVEDLIHAGATCYKVPEVLYTHN